MILLNVMNQKPGKFLGTVIQGGNNKKRKEKKIYTTLNFCGEGVGVAADMFQRILNSPYAYFENTPKEFYHGWRIR
jgi:hypothetical protein